MRERKNIYYNVALKSKVDSSGFTDNSGTGDKIQVTGSLSRPHSGYIVCRNIVGLVTSSADTENVTPTNYNQFTYNVIGTFADLGDPEPDDTVYLISDDVLEGFIDRLVTTEHAFYGTAYNTYNSITTETVTFDLESKYKFSLSGSTPGSYRIMKDIAGSECMILVDCDDSYAKKIVYNSTSSIPSRNGEVRFRINARLIA